MSKQGYIKLDRSLQNNWIWQEKPFSKGQAWVDLIMLANHKDKKELHGGKIVEYKRGVVNRSISYLADKWGWDRRMVSRFLSVLESDRMVSVNGTTHGTTITVVNYDNFQGHGTANGTTHGTTDAQVMVQPMRTNNNDKNDKNDKNGKKREGTAPHSDIPTLDDVKRFAKESGATCDPELFFRYYEEREWKRSRGLPVTDWKKTFATWEARERKKSVRSASEKYDNHPKQWEGYDDLTEELFGK